MELRELRALDCLLTAGSAERIVQNEVSNGGVADVGLRNACASALNTVLLELSATMSPILLCRASVNSISLLPCSPVLPYVLNNSVPSSVPRSYRALADHSGVPRSTLHSRAHGRQSIEAKGRSQQYLTPSEEKAMVEFILHMSALRHPVRIKHLPFIALSATRHRPTPDRPLKPPGKNWTKTLEGRHPDLNARKVKALDWNRYEKNISSKITH